MTKEPKLLEDCDPAAVAKADPLYVDIVATIQERHPFAFQGDVDGGLKTVVALAAVMATVFAAFRFHQTTERWALLETENDTFQHIRDLADVLRSGRGIARGDAAMTERIQRKRTRGWKMPPDTIYVGRPTRWGNPYYEGSGMSRGFFDEQMRPCEYDVRDPRTQVMWFRERMAEMQHERPEEFERFLAPLRGQHLACWCAVGRPCHADVLLKLANP